MTAVLRSVDPATRLEIATYPATDDAALERVLENAAAAFRSWRSAPVSERADALRAIAARLRAEREPYARLITAEMGKPIGEARAEIDKCAWVCEYYAEAGPGFLADEDVEADADANYVQFPPLGVVLAIMPWNYPFWQVMRFAAPALMAGNTVVLKHAANVSGCGLAVADAVTGAGLPDHLLQTILVRGAETEKVIADPRIAAVTLTGSEEVGMTVGATCGRHLKKAVLELGGSDGFVVLADADLEQAAKVAVRARFQNVGQSCIAAKRFIVVDAVAEEFEQRFAAAAAELRLGDPSEEATDLGPMARVDLRDELAEQLAAGLAHGGRLVLGGGVPDRPGAFLEATLVADVVPGSPLFDEETFGPVGAIVRAADEDEAIRLLNLSRFGLSSSIWSADRDRARRLAPRIEAGAVFVNSMSASDPRMPFGGVKHSGYGRELGKYGIREFVNVQGITVN